MTKPSPRKSETTSQRPRVSDTYRRIYAVVARIPRGRVATYGQVAALAGLPHAPRVAGYALHALHGHSPLPWYRVVAAGAGSASPASTLRPRPPSACASSGKAWPSTHAAAS
jgi:alkylated DNA nucleotide flippase Atl1